MNVRQDRFEPKKWEKKKKEYQMRELRDVTRRKSKQTGKKGGVGFPQGGGGAFLRKKIQKKKN